jgi:hypothetical protein
MNISTIYVYITRLTSNEISSPSNKIHREVGRAKDLIDTPVYYRHLIVGLKLGAVVEETCLGKF